MDEARAVLTRLERIERLEAAGASPSLLLAEVRALLTEAEAWVRTERGDTRAAAEAVERTRAAVPVSTGIL